MLDVNFDIEFSGSNELFTDEKISELKEGVLNELANKFAIELSKKPDGVLNKTKQTYKDAIEVESNGENVSLVFNKEDKFLPHMLETGISKSWDLKGGLLASPKARIAKNGQKYIIVPIDPSIGDFRVVSESSRADSWIHPPYEGNNFIGKTKEEFEQQKIIDEYVKWFINNNFK